MKHFALILLILFSTLAHAGKDDPITLTECAKLAEKLADAYESSLMKWIIRQGLKKEDEFKKLPKKRQKLAVSLIMAKVADITKATANKECGNLVTQKKTKKEALDYFTKDMEKQLKTALEDEDFLESLFAVSCKPNENESASILNFKNDFKNSFSLPHGDSEDAETILVPGSKPVRPKGKTEEISG